MMIIGTIKVRIHVPWVHSLKEKRSIVKSMVAKIRQKFNVSIAEIEEQDRHQHIVLGIAFVSNGQKMADRSCRQVLNFIDQNTEGTIVDEDLEFR